MTAALWNQIVSWWCWWVWSVDCVCSQRCSNNNSMEGLSIPEEEFSLKCNKNRRGVVVRVCFFIHSCSGLHEYVCRGNHPFCRRWFRPVWSRRWSFVGVNNCGQIVGNIWRSTWRTCAFWTAVVICVGALSLYVKLKTQLTFGLTIVSEIERKDHTKKNNKERKRTKSEKQFEQPPRRMSRASGHGWGSSSLLSNAQTKSCRRTWTDLRS